jgi:hypothetical protein
MKCVPWSLINTLGHPNIVITFSNKKGAVVSALQYFTSADSAHLVRYFVVLIMYLSPVLLVGVLIGPTKSIAHFSNTYNVTCVS